MRKKIKDYREKVYNKYRHWNFMLFQNNYPMYKEGMREGKGRGSSVRRYEQVVNLLHEEAAISKYCYMQQTHGQ
jgi:hypothetical protein